MGYIRLRKMKSGDFWVYSKDYADRFVGAISAGEEGYYFYVPTTQVEELLHNGYSWDEACKKAQKASVYECQKWDI